MAKNTKGAFGSRKQNGFKMICFHTWIAHKFNESNFPVKVYKKFKSKVGDIVVKNIGFLSVQACRKQEVRKKYSREAVA